MEESPVKKLVAIAMVILLFVPVLSAYADPVTIDLGTMSFDELVALKNEINKAILDSGNAKEVTIPPGIYIVGQDIPAGGYSAVAGNVMFAVVEVTPRGEDFFSAMYALTGDDNEIGRLDLKDGDTLEITGTSLVFKKFSGFDF